MELFLTAIIFASFALAAVWIAYLLGRSKGFSEGRAAPTLYVGFIQGQIIPGTESENPSTCWRKIKDWREEQGFFRLTTKQLKARSWEVNKVGS